MLARALSGALLLSFAVSGCKVLWNAAKQDVQKKVRDQAGPGEIPPEPPVVVGEPIIVNSVLPNRGEIGGGLFVEIVGLGFRTGAVVYFGDNPAEETDTVVLTENRIQTMTPEGVVGVVPIKIVIQGVGAGTIDGGFEYYEPVTLTGITPTRGPTLGGTKVMLTGTGFVAGTEVRFGAGGPLRATVIDSSRAEVTAPRQPHATYDVTVANGNGAATLSDAFAVYEIVRVRDVSPFSGPLQGLTAITVRGTGFVTPSALTLGGQALVNYSNAAETELAATTLPALPASEGPVDVLVVNESGNARLRGGFVFVDMADPTPRVTAVTPAIGLVGGGNTVHIAGRGFASAATTVTFSTDVATCQVLSDTMIDCVAPPHAEGTVDVRVVNAGMDVVDVNAYTYIELRIDALLPNVGAVAGGTYVILYGNGFGGETDIILADAPAVDVTILDANRVAFRTPSAPIGLADLRVVRDGLEVDAAEAYTYFDPLNTAQWSSGGSIEGSVNVTVIDADGRLEGAFVMLGVDPTTRYQGFTNPRGQITFSGPDVMGVQTVSAGKANHTSFSWVDVDAENLTLWAPKYPEYTSGTAVCGSHSPIVAGKVSRIKDEYNLGNDYVQVTTTSKYLGSFVADPGPNAFMVNQGTYELWSRTGDLVVVALAGTDDGSGALRVHAMGFYPYMFVDKGSEEACEADPDCPTGEVCYEYGEKTSCGRMLTCVNDNDCGDLERCVQQGAVSLCVRPDSCCVSDDNCNPLGGELCMAVLPDKVCTKRYDNIDITIDTPLKQQLRIDLDEPPIAVDPEDIGFVPDTTAAQVWYDFGYLGVQAMADIAIPATDVMFVSMPQALPGGLAGSEFKVMAGTYLGWDSAAATPRQALAEVHVEDLSDTTVPVVVTPFLGTQREVAPAYLGFTSSPMHFEFTVSKETLPSANVHALYADAGGQTWMVFTPAQTRSFDLPVFPDIAADARHPSGVAYWQLYAMYSPGALFNRLDPDVLFAWKSRAVLLTMFEVP